MGDTYFARICGEIAERGRIAQGPMLADANLMLLGVVSASQGACLLVHPLVKVEEVLLVKGEEVLGHQAQQTRMYQTRSRSCVLVMNNAKR